jgi:hypothetical protein
MTQIIFGEGYRSLSLLHSPLDPNIFLNTFFSSTLSIYSSLKVSDQVSHPYKSAEKVIVLYILMFILPESKLEGKNSSLNDSEIFLISVCS